MSGPWPHPHSRIFYFRKDTPSDLKRQKARLKALGVGYRDSIHRSLETRDPKEAQKAYSAVLLEVSAMWDGWRKLLESQGRPLSHAEKAGFVREMVSALIEEHEQDPSSLPQIPPLPVPEETGSTHTDAALAKMSEGDRDELRALVVRFMKAKPKAQSAMVKQWAVEALRGEGPYFLFKDVAPDFAKAVVAVAGPQLASVQRRLGAVWSPSHQQQLAVEALPLLTKGRAALAAAADYEFRPIAELRAQVAAMPKATIGATSCEKGVTITALFELWKRDHDANMRAKATAEEYKVKVGVFTKWLGHDDALAVTKGDLADFADHLRHEKGISAKTVQGKYLTCLKAIFRKGFDRDLLKENVAASARIDVPKKIVTRSKGFSDDEAKAILSLANRSLLPRVDGKPDKRSMANRVAGRWVPWLQCYTGARVAEITQLRKEDIIEEYGVYCLRVTPEAGSVKTGEYRLVPIHPHLVDMGFLDFVNGHKAGPLFYDPNKKRKDGKNTPAQWAGNALARWIKGELAAAWPNVQPNHAWRHRFKTLGREVEMDLHYLNVLQGHKDGTAAAGYGETTIKALYREMCKIPRIVPQT